MTHRMLTLLAIGVGVLLVGATLLYMRPTNAPSKLTLEVLGLLDIKKEQVLGITISQGKNTTELVNQQGRWTAGAAPALESTLTEFFNALKSLTVLSLVSQNKANAAEFNLTKEGGIDLSLKTADGVTALTMGKNGAATDTFYIKKQGSDNVYLVQGTLRKVLTQDPATWAEKPVVPKSEKAAVKLAPVNKKKK